MSKSIVIKPVTGFLDLRSEPEDVPVGGYRYIQNMAVVQKNRQCRMPGWSRLMDSDSGYNNPDLHDQLLSLTGKSARHAVNFMFEAESTLKTTMLFAGTEDALFQLNVGTGNWRVLSSTMGNWKQGAQNRDTIVFTNDHDEPQYWVFDSPPALSAIPDLQELGISKVGVIVTFRGVTFYMNVVQDGHTYAHRVLWSDIDNPLSLIPGEDSLAGDLDIDSGEAILNAKALANVLLVYTTRGIWEISLSSSDIVFSAAKRYDSEKSSESVLAYRNTLVSVGDTHVFMGESAIYEYSLFEPKPKLIEWVHRASSIIFDEIDSANCYGPVAGYDSERHQIWISWVPRGSTLPSRALVLNTQLAFSSIVDHGFTAFCQFMPRLQSTVLRDWLMQNCICTAAQLLEFFGESEGEGGYCQAPTFATCDTQPDSFYNSTPLELEDGIVMEDFNAADPSDNSLCARLNGLTLADTCVAESQSDQCNAARLFVMASASDFCLKQTSDSYYRDHCTAFTACGTYEQRGYKSILRSGPLSFKNFEDEKRLENFVVEASVVDQMVPSQLALRVGASMQALDPNLECGIVWQTQIPRDLKCQGGATEAQHLANNTRPDGRFEWPMYWIGTNLYFELTIENTKSTPRDTGGAVCFSKFVMEITPQPVRY